MQIRTKELSVSLSALALACTQAWANPTGPTVANGTASFVTNGNALTITNSPNTIINWQGFSIAAGESTRFVQQSASSAVLNRGVSSNVSSIRGTLQSNGRVFLVNPNGILFSSGTRVDTAAFTGTTGTVTDAAFLAGNTTPTGASSTVSFDGLLNVDGSFNILDSGISANSNLGFSGNAQFSTVGVIDLQGIISGGPLTFTALTSPTMGTGGPLITSPNLPASPGTILVSNTSTTVQGTGKLGGNGNSDLGTPGITANTPVGLTSGNISIGQSGSLTTATPPPSIASSNLSNPASPIATSLTSTAITAHPVPMQPVRENIALDSLPPFRNALSGSPVANQGNNASSLGAAIAPAARSSTVSVNLQKREPVF